MIEVMKKFKTFNVRFPIEKHKELKKLSYETNKSIAMIFREAIDKYIKERNKKSKDN